MVRSSQYHHYSALHFIILILVTIYTPRPESALLSYLPTIQDLIAQHFNSVLTTDSVLWCTLITYIILGQRVCISARALLPRALAPNQDGSCIKYTVSASESCAQIAVKFNATISQIEGWNSGTYKWKGKQVHMHPEPV